MALECKLFLLTYLVKFLLYAFRWTIALKTLRTKNENEKNGRSSNCLKSSTSGYDTNETCDDEENISLLIDEAKTMMKVGEYHEFIVNLQGITVKLQDDLTYQVIIYQSNIVRKVVF